MILWDAQCKNSRCRAFWLYSGVKIWRPPFEGYKQKSEFFQSWSFCLLCFRAPPGLVKALFSLDAFLLNIFPKLFIFKPRPTELLILCLVTDLPVAKTRHMQLQMPCLVVLRERPLKLHVSEPHVSEPRSHVSKPHLLSLTLTLSSLALLSLTFISLTLRVPPFWASPCRLSTLLRPCPHCTRSSFPKHLSYLSHVNATRFEAS